MIILIPYYKLKGNPKVFPFWESMTLISFPQALFRLSKHNVGMFQNVIEKVGMPKVLSTLSLPITRIQQATVTMLAMLLSSDTRLHRFLQDKVSQTVCGTFTRTGSPDAFIYVFLTKSCNARTMLTFIYLIITSYRIYWRISQIFYDYYTSNISWGSTVLRRVFR